MKRTKKNFKIAEKDNGDVFWNDVFIQPLGENRIIIKNQEFDITFDIQAYFTKTKLTTKFLDNIEKETVFDMLENVGIYDNIPKIGLKSLKMIDNLNILPKAIANIRKPSFPVIGNVEDSSDLQGDGVKIFIPSNIIDIYTRHEVLLGLKRSGYTDTSTEASKLIDEKYKRGEIQN